MPHIAGVYKYGDIIIIIIATTIFIDINTSIGWLVIAYTIYYTSDCIDNDKNTNELHYITYTTKQNKTQIHG